MSETLCKFCGYVYDSSQMNVCPQCSMRPEHLVCQGCGALFNPHTSKDHKCPSCGKMAPEGWDDEQYFLLKGDVKTSSDTRCPEI